MADLSNISEEIKRIEELKTKYQSLLSVERDVNQTLLYSTGVRKKYGDAIHAAAEIQKDIIRKEHEYESIIVKNSHALNLNMKQHKKLTEEQKKLVKVQKDLEKQGKHRTDEYKKNKKLLNENYKAVQHSKDAIDGYEKAMQDAIDGTDKLTTSTGGLKQVFEDIAKLDSSKISSQKDLNNITKARLDLMRQQLDIQEKSGIVSTDDANKLKDKLGMIEEMHTIQGDLLKQQVPDNLESLVNDLTKNAQELTDPKKFKKDSTKELARSRTAAESRTGVSLGKAQMDSLKTIFSGKSSFGDKLKAVKSHGAAGKDLEKLNEVMKLTGKGALGAGNMMKMLGSALGSLGKLGWVGLIVQAVTAVAKAVNELDKFLKGFNQSFAKLQGPTVLMKNVDKEMDNFTDAIFNLQRNLKYGLKSEEIIGMFQGVAESGMSLQGLLKSVEGGYGKMIESAAKVHLNFGVSMEEAGSMISEQMTDLRSSVDEASEAFKMLSYDASIAGIQSQKFYQATYAAAEALSYYGKFLTSASTTLKKFQEQGGMGFKDAQKQTQTMTNLFKDMDKNTRVAFMEMSGGIESYRKDFIKVQQDSEKAMKTHSDNIAKKRKGLEDAKSRGDQEAVNRLNDEIAAEEKQLTNAEKRFAMASTAAKSNGQDMALYLELLSDKVGDKMGDYFAALKKNHGPDIFKDSRAVLEHMKAVLGVSDEFAMQMIGTVQTTEVGLRRMAKDVKDLVSDLPDNKKSDFNKKVQDIIKNGMDGEVMNLNSIKEGLDKYGAETGKDMSSIYDYIQKYPTAVSTLLEKGFDAFIRDIQNITLKELKNVEQVTGETSSEEAKRLDDIVKNTHTIEDFIGINKENATYFLAGVDVQKEAAKAAIWAARSTSSILTWVQRIAKGDKKTGRTEEEFRSSDDYKKLGQLMEEEIIVNKELASATVHSDRWAELTAKKKNIEEEKKRVAGDNLYQQDELVGSSAENVKKMYAEKEALNKRIADLEAQAANNTGEEKTRIEGMIKDLKGESQKKSYGIDILQTKPVEKQKDFRAKSDGYARLSEGDVVVNDKGIASGIGGNYGAFAGQASSKLMESMSSAMSGGAAPQIPVTISIGSISGDPEEFLSRIKPAIEQAFERMYYDKQKRR